MNDADSHPSRALTSDEERILRLIQQIYGNHNTADKCFMTNGGEIAIFARDSDGHSVIMVNLTFVADISREQDLTDKAIKDTWLRP
jgi:hypothetical protein